MVVDGVVCLDRESGSEGGSRVCCAWVGRGVKRGDEMRVPGRWNVGRGHVAVSSLRYTHAVRKTLQDARSRDTTSVIRHHRMSRDYEAGGLQPQFTLTALSSPHMLTAT